jgi:purine-nucleoside phosphorylase
MRQLDSSREEACVKGLYEKIEEAKQHIRKLTPATPRFALILGTGLGAMADAIETDAKIPYGDIPHFATSTSIGHEGNLIVGKLGGREVVAMQGRLHYYEGYSMQEVTFPLRVMRALGAEQLIMSNAVGGMAPHLDRGDIVVITDHLNLMGDNPLIGWNDDRLGERFPDMSEPYSVEARNLVEAIALAKKIVVRRAVIASVAGPNLETAAEYRFLRRVGADVVGMSMVPETLVAIHGGMTVLGLAIVTDICLPDSLGPANLADIIATANSTEPKLTILVTEYLKRV